MKLTSSSGLTKQRDPSWSSRIGQRYALQIDDCLADWLDSEMWRQLGSGEFNQAVSPDMLLAEVPDVIWPGLMLPDALPIIGNKYGDWICLRVGADNTIREVVHWYHGGGDWIPWGRTLAEAIYFDAIRDRLPGRRQAHAIAAEPRRQGNRDDVLLRWALRWLPESASAWMNEATSAISSQRLIDAGIAEVAVRCEVVLHALDSEFRQSLTPEIASQLSIDWEPEAVSWLFDQAFVDQPTRTAVTQLVGKECSYHQDWELAKSHCIEVCRQRSDLGWAWDVAGWAAEKRGEFNVSQSFYAGGVLALAFADQSIRFRTHWYPQAKGKFSTWRFAETLGQNSSDVQVAAPETDGKHNTEGATNEHLAARYLNAIQQADARTLRTLATDFWTAEGDSMLAENQASRAYDAYYRAGWDLGIDSMNGYRRQLRGLIESATRAGQHARAAVAQTHLDSLTQRLGDD